MFGWRNLVDACGRGPHCCEFESRPEHHRLVAQTRQRQHAQTVSSVGSNPTEPTNAPVVQLVETAALKAAQCRFESGEAHHTPLSMANYKNWRSPAVLMP